MPEIPEDRLTRLEMAIERLGSDVRVAAAAVPTACCSNSSNAGQQVEETPSETAAERR